MSISTKKFILNWRIENFTVCRLEKGTYLTSKNVVAKSLCDTEWFLKLSYQEKSDSNELVMRIDLGRSADNSNLHELEVDSHFEIIRPDGLVLYISEYKRGTFLKEGFMEDIFSVSLNNLMKKIELLIDDVIVIRCYLFSNIYSQISSAECIVWNKIGTRKYFDRVVLKIPDSSSWFQNTVIAVDQFSYVAVNFCSPNQFLQFKCDNTNKEISNSNLSCKLSLLNGSNILFSKRYMKFLSGENACKLYTFLESKKLFEKNGVFSLLFEFSSSNETMSCGEEYLLDSDELSITSSLNNFEIELYNLIFSKYCGDVCLYYGNEMNFVRAHKCILMARSNVFQDMLQKRDLVVTKLDKDTLFCLLCFLYTNRVIYWSINTAMNLLLAAKTYQITSLTEQCCSFLRSKLNDSNVHKIHELAVKLENVKLIEATVKYQQRSTATNIIS